jgi:hypothetical protein
MKKFIRTEYSLDLNRLESIINARLAKIAEIVPSPLNLEASVAIRDAYGVDGAFYAVITYTADEEITEWD